MNTKPKTGQHRAENRQREQLTQRSKTQTGTRANWQAKFDQYLAQARIWAAAGDTVEAENCYQHAEHYFRMLRSIPASA